MSASNEAHRSARYVMVFLIRFDKMAMVSSSTGKKHDYSEPEGDPVQELAQRAKERAQRRG